MSLVVNPRDARIIDKVFADIRPMPAKNKYRFFSTGSSDMLLKGIDVDLQMTFDPENCKRYLMDQLSGKVNTNNMDLIVYLAGGIPFLGGTLADIYTESSGRQVKPYIYGVLTRKVSDQDLNEIHYGLCNASNDKQKLLLSPLCDSELSGLYDMACLLGYLNNDGTKSDRLLKASAALIRFPPLITSLHRVMDRNDVTGRDIITICSTFHTYFTHIISSVTPPGQIFNYGLRCCNIITHIENIPEDLPMLIVDLKAEKENPNAQFLVKLNQPSIAYFWKNDSGDPFNYVKTEKFEPKAIEDANKSFVSFTPLAPLSVRVVTGCTIIKGKDHSYLYVSDSALKGADMTNMVDIIDPNVGVASSVNIEDFARHAGDGTIEKVANLIDPEQVKQVIYVCFDASESMGWPLSGYKDRELVKKGVESRIVIATQYLTNFANKTYGYRIPCLLGLMAFNQRIDFRCPLSPLVPDFEDKGLKDIIPIGQTYLWDALSDACDNIIEYTIDEKGNPKFPNAVNRLIVISDGEDVNSKKKYPEVAQKLFEKKIVVDSIIISTEEQCKQLAVLSHLTGGIAYNVEKALDGLKLFEESAFLDIKERKSSLKPIIKDDRNTTLAKLQPKDITKEFLDKAVTCIEFDKHTSSTVMYKIAGKPKLSTPEYVCFTNKNTQVPNPRRRRILRELLYAAQVMKEGNDNERYDRDVKVYPLSSNCDIWVVFIRAPDDTPYLGKWFKLLVTFPELYPVEPPIFRFVSIPYHLNVSSEGRICLDIIEKGYISSQQVIEIIQQIKQLFLFPCIETPTQIRILDIYSDQNTRDEYERLARESAEQVGKDDYNEFITGCYINKVDPNENYSLQFDSTNYPPYMRSVISNRKMEDPVMVPDIGQIYDRKELKQYVSSNINPICKYTGKLIKLTVDQIDALDSYHFPESP